MSTPIVFVSKDGHEYSIEDVISLVLKAGGDIYSKTMTMSDNNATRFETATKVLLDIVILVETNPMLLGAKDVEVLSVTAGGVLGFTKADMSTLYFKNANADNNGKITILGVEE